MQFCSFETLISSNIKFLHLLLFFVPLIAYLGCSSVTLIYLGVALMNSYFSLKKMKFFAHVKLLIEAFSMSSNIKFPTFSSPINLFL